MRLTKLSITADILHNERMKNDMEHPIFKLEEHIATISTSKKSTLELNRVSFNDYPAKLDIRRWGTGPDGERVPYKGVQLNDYEFEALRKIIADE